jgi:hypothetical protein
VIQTQCRTADIRMSITFDAIPWFSEADTESIIQLAQHLGC